MEFVSNGHIVGLMKEKGIQEACNFLSRKEGLKTTNATLLKDLDKLMKRCQYLNKSKSRVKGKENFDRFMAAAYTYPTPRDTSSTDSECKGSGPLQSTSEPFLVCDSSSFTKTETMERVAVELTGELVELREEKERVEEELNTIVEEKDQLNESVESCEGTIKNQRKQLKRTSNREAYWRGKYQKLENNKGDEIYYTVEDMNVLQMKIDQLENENRYKGQIIDEINERVHELESQNTELNKMHNGEYFDEKSKTYSFRLNECVYSLLNNHVAFENIGSVITSVLNLVNVKPNKLPSVGTIHSWSIERGLIAKKQVGEKAGDKNTTLHTDEASKYGQKWGAFATRDSEGTYRLLGLKDMATKSSHDTLETFQDILKDIDDVAGNGSGNKILVNIKNTMSDRASTETKFNKLLAEYRDEILPEVIENYGHMCEDEKLSISRMNNFFCGLHTLVHMADAAQKAIFDTEKLHFENGEIPILNKSFEKAGQPGTIRLILTACKAFARRGDPKNGCHGNFVTFISHFLKEHKMAFPLQPLKGNRFNILFTNAGHVYYFHKFMKDFLDKTSSMNGLLLSVQKDLSEPFFLAGCKALGLISKYITTPLWRVIERKEITISLMNTRYLHLLNYLEDVIQNLDEFISGNLFLYDDVPVKKDIVHDYLIESSDIDCHVIVILSVVLPAFVKLIKHQYGDHLPGGKHAYINEGETASVDKHNKFPERVFSYVDHILSSKPNISTLTMESHVTFSLNQTSQWLSKQENADEIIKESRKGVRSEKLKFKQREDVIRAKRLEKQNEDFRKKEELERKRIERLEKETNDMTYYGLWQSEEQMTTALNKINSKKEKEEALRVQLRFRKNVFSQKCDENVYSFSKVVDGKRVLLSVDELKINVLTLINKAANSPSPDEPHLLCGKAIEHRFLESDGSSKWYTGKVISQVPGYPLWFNLLYDGDDDVYTAKLSEEYQVGDVIIKV